MASALWVWLGKRVAGSGVLGWFSLVCLLAALVTVVLMAQAAQSGQLFGLYQRLNYGVSVSWVACVAFCSLRPALANRFRIATT